MKKTRSTQRTDWLLTEERNPSSFDIDLLSTEEMLRVINREDALVPLAVAKVVPEIARAIEIGAEALKHGGRLIYVGAGTSGRLGVLDASECPPTFNVEPTLVQGVLAGGMQATHRSLEEAEDDAKAGAAVMKKKRVNAKDIVAGVAASGRTPFTLGALRYARKMGARTISVTCNPNSEMAALVEISIAPVVGPEVITGSTRMKAGTAQKLVLNMLTTGIMIKLGHVYSNLMVNMRMRNRKLQERGCRIIMAIAEVDEPAARRALLQAGGDLKVAVVMLKKGESTEKASQRLKRAGTNLRIALEDGWV